MVTGDSIKRTCYVCVISLASLLILQSLASSIFLRLQHNQLNKQLVNRRAEIQSIIDGELLSEPLNVSGTDVLQRAKREVGRANNRRNKKSRTNQRRRKGMCTPDPY